MQQKNIRNFFVPESKSELVQRQQTSAIHNGDAITRYRAQLRANAAKRLSQSAE